MRRKRYTTLHGMSWFRSIVKFLQNSNGGTWLVGSFSFLVKSVSCEFLFVKLREVSSKEGVFLDEFYGLPKDSRPHQSLTRISVSGVVDCSPLPRPGIRRRRPPGSLTPRSLSMTGLDLVFEFPDVLRVLFPCLKLKRPLSHIWERVLKVFPITDFVLVSHS